MVPALSDFTVSWKIKTSPYANEKQYKSAFIGNIQGTLTDTERTMTGAKEGLLNKVTSKKTPEGPTWVRHGKEDRKTEEGKERK